MMFLHFKILTFFLFVDTILAISLIPTFTENATSADLVNSYKNLLVVKQPKPLSLKFTLAIVMAEHSDIDLEKLLGVLGETTKPSYNKLMTASRVQQGKNKKLDHIKKSMWDLAESIHFRINPVRIDGIGLDRIVKKTFCDPNSVGTNSIFFLVDENAATKHNGVLLANFMAMISNYAGLPAIAWSNTPVVELEQLTKVEMPTLLLAPSVKMQALTIFHFLRNQLPDFESTTMISRKAAGYNVFSNVMKRLTTKLGRFSKNSFDSDHEKHAGKESGFIEVTDTDATSMHNLRERLRFLRDHTEIRAFILYMEPLETETVIRQAHFLGMTTTYYFWICGRPSFVEPPNIPFNYPPGLLVVTYNTSAEVQKIAIKAVTRIWMSAVRRLAPISRLGSELIPIISCTHFAAPKWKYGKLFHVMLKHRVKKLFYNKKHSAFTNITSMKVIGLDISRKWTNVANWNSRRGLEIENKNWLRQYHGLRATQQHFKHFLRIVLLDEAPYIIYTLPDQIGRCDKIAVPCRLSTSKLDADDHIHVLKSNEYVTIERGNLTEICCQGFVIDLIKKLSQDIGFRYELFEAEDRKWGGFNESFQKWNGLIQTILEDKADVVGTSLKINTARSSAIDFTVPFHHTGVTILVKVQEGMVSSMPYLEPFSPATWLIVFFGCINLAAFCLFWFEKLNRSIDNEIRRYQRLSISPFRHRRYIFESYWIVLSVFFNTTMKADTPKSLSGKFLLNIWALFCVIFMSSFMANLAAFMISKEKYHDFSGIDDVRFSNPYSRNPPWRFGTIPSGATEHIIRGNFPEMYNYMRPFMHNDVDDGIQSILNENLDAFFYDASVLVYKAGRDTSCRLKTVGKWFASAGYGFGLPKSSKWLHQFNQKILGYQSSGYLQHLEDFWLRSTCNALHNKEKTQKSRELSIIHMSSLFLILAVGIFLCGLFVVTHREYAKFRSKTRNKKPATGAEGKDKSAENKPITQKLPWLVIKRLRRQTNEE